MKDLHDIILGPIITERSVEMSLEGRYQFKVAMDAGKIEIGLALEGIYKANKIKVIKVNTTTVHGKTKMYARRTPGKRPDWKKATVRLLPGQTIEDFTV
ncbi:MAG: 50S ribosomal protein L23 [bacterium]|jgi:large subunit ribosomal protein L23